MWSNKFGATVPFYPVIGGDRAETASLSQLERTARYLGAWTDQCIGTRGEIEAAVKVEINGRCQAAVDALVAQLEREMRDL